MAVLKPRNRLVYFRISEEEFEQITRACEASGARSVSDLARIAMERVIHDVRDPDSPLLGGQVDALARSIRQLERRIQSLAELVEERTTQSRSGAAELGVRATVETKEQAG